MTGGVATSTTDGVATSTPSVSVVVPVYNEIELCATSLHRIHEFMRRRVAAFEIIVIESGSTDGSDIACDRAAADLPHVRVIHEGRRNGMGAALRLGYREARLDLVWLVTADLPFALETLLTALPLIAESDCVLSYRSNDTRTPFRRIQSWIYNKIIKVALDLPMRSVNSAFKLYRREFLQKLPLTSNGWFLDAEVLFWIARRGLRYSEIPVPLLERELGRSKVTITDPLKILRELITFKCALHKAGRRLSDKDRVPFLL